MNQGMSVVNVEKSKQRAESRLLILQKEKKSPVASREQHIEDIVASAAHVKVLICWFVIR